MPTEMRNSNFSNRKSASLLCGFILGRKELSLNDKTTIHFLVIEIRTGWAAFVFPKDSYFTEPFFHVWIWSQAICLWFYTIFNIRCFHWIHSTPTYHTEEKNPWVSVCRQANKKIITKHHSNETELRSSYTWHFMSRVSHPFSAFGQNV